MNLVSRGLNKLKRLPGKTREIRSNTICLRLRLNFVLYFFLLMMIPVLIFGVLFYFQSQKVIHKNADSLALENISKTSQNLDGYMDNLSALSQSIVRNPDFSSQLKNLILKKAVSGLPTQSGSIHILEGLKLDLSSSLYPHSSDLNGIYLVYNDIVYKIYNKDHDILSESNILDEDWYKESVGHPGKVGFVGTEMRFFEDSTYQYVFSTSYTQSHFMGSEPATFLFDFEINSLESILTSSVHDSNLESDLYVVNEDNIIMYCKDLGILTTKLDQVPEKGSYGSKSIERDDHPRYMVYYTSPDTGWKIVDFFQVGKIIRGAFFSPDLIALFIILTVVCVYLFSLTISVKLLRPFQALTTAVSQHEKNEFSMSGSSANDFPSPAGEEGISNMDKLVHKIYSTQIQQKEAQLKSLQNQINPHFLYNTLESIRGAALYYGADTIAEMSKCLSLFFRYSISDNVLVSIRDEIQHLENYMAIQNFRHENKFELVYNIPEQLRDFKILKLSLQPLVENAIKHGLEMRMGKGKIMISAFTLGNLIRIQIQDNGTGIPQKKLEELTQLLQSDIPVTPNSVSEGTGVGVQNVNSRIKIYFGKQYGLKYSSSETGTTVEITIPAVES